jgi:hypothetical protein
LYYVVLDTNIYRQNPSRDNLHFRALERLSKGKIIRLYIPYIIMREFQTQQREIYSKDLDKALSGVTGLTRKQLDSALLYKLKDIKEKLENDSESILDGAEAQFTDWAKDIGAEIYPLCIDQTNAALEAYFQGNTPLNSVKNRNDIPDSFIVQSINKLRSEVGEVHAVVKDGKVRDAFSGDDKITTYEDLPGFIESEPIQNELKDLDLIDNIGQIVDAIEQYESDNSEIMNFIANNVGKSIVWKTFSDPSIPDDNNEATINSYDEAEDVELHFKEIAYYGNGQFGIPFDLKISVLADYYIFKSDYYCMDPEREHVPHVSDHNKHYFEAEEEFELCVSGLISIEIDRDKINLEDVSECIDEEHFAIDEITDIRLC